MTASDILNAVAVFGGAVVSALLLRGQAKADKTQADIHTLVNASHQALADKVEGLTAEVLAAAKAAPAENAPPPV